MRRSPWLPCMLALALAAGCKVTAPPLARPQGASPAPAIAMTPQASPPSGPPTVTPASPGEVASGAASLLGRIRAPAGIVSNNGGSLVGNNGGGYQLMALAQPPVANRKVVLRDAAGQPVLRDGRPLETTTGADGSYRFDGALPAGNLVVAVPLGAEGAALQAVATRDRAHEVDVDLFSTLAATYILERYVHGQPAPAETLDRLTTEAAEATQQAAAAAFEAQELAVPGDLGAAAMAETVEAMRAGNPGLDRQLEAVRKLLIPAGQSALGVGQPALEVGLPRLATLLPLAGGELLMLSVRVRQLFRLDAGGRLQIEAGAGNQAAAAAADPAPDQLATEFAFGQLLGIAPGPGGTLVLETQRLTRLRPDHTLELLWPWSPERLYATAAGPNDTVWLLAASGAWSLGPAGRKERVHTFDAAQLALLKTCVAAGRDQDGRLYVATNSPSSRQTGEVYRIDPASWAFEQVFEANQDGAVAMSLAPDGTIFTRTAAGLSIASAGAAPRLVLPPVNLDATLALEAAVGLAPDGTPYIAGRSGVFRIQDRAVVRVAGREQVGVDELGQVVLDKPDTLVVHPDGSLLISLIADRRIVKVSPDGLVEPFVGVGAVSDQVTFADLPAADAVLGTPTTLRAGPAGELYFAEYTELEGAWRFQLRRVEPDGLLRVVLKFPGGEGVKDLAVLPDGRFVTSSIIHKDRRTRALLKLWAADGSLVEELLRTPFGEVEAPPEPRSLAVDGQGGLLLMHSGVLERWTPGAGIQLVKEDARFYAGNPGAVDVSRMAADAEGRLYFVPSGAKKVWRYDPKGDRFKQIAGAGSRRFAGTGVDDSLVNVGGLAFNRAGDLFFCDRDHNQVKRIAAGELE